MTGRWIEVPCERCGETVLHYPIAGDKAYPVLCQGCVTPADRDKWLRERFPVMHLLQHLAELEGER